jgi:dTDP-4-dehydrorhamnose reductase
MALLDSVLITGGSGMLAHAFKDLMRARQLNAFAPSRGELDITSVPDLLAAFDRLKPTLVLNCAAYTKVDLAEKEKEAALAINGKAAGNVAEVCRRRGAAMVHFSTDYVFDGSMHRPLRPTDPVGPKGVYGASKLLGERMIQDAPPERWLILRTAWLYGPGGPNFVQTMLNAARAGKPLKVINDQVGCPTYTYDLAEATLRLLETDANGIYHVSNSGQTNWFEFTQVIMDEFGVTPKSLDPITSADWKAIKPDSAARPSYSVFDLSPLEDKIARPMPDWRDGLRRYRERVEAT